MAQEAGAGRIEFVSSIELGGLSASVEAVRQAVRTCSIPILVMVRPRSGGFHFSPLEEELLIEESKFWLTQSDVHLQGIVTGALNKNAELELRVLKQIAESKGENTLVCHRCFDLTADPFAAMEQLIDLGFTRILTSGQRSTAMEGIELLRELRERAAGRIEILPAGGIRAENAATVLSRTGCNQVHLGPFLSIESVSKNAERGIDYGGHLVVDEEEIRRLRKAIEAREEVN